MKKIFFLLLMAISIRTQAQPVPDTIQNNKYRALEYLYDDGRPGMLQFISYDDDFLWIHYWEWESDIHKLLAFDENLNIVRHIDNLYASYKLNDKFYIAELYVGNPSSSYNTCDSIMFKSRDEHGNMLVEKKIFDRSEDTFSYLSQGAQVKKLRNNTFLIVVQSKEVVDSNDLWSKWDCAARRLILVDTLGNVLNARTWLIPNQERNTGLCESAGHIIISTCSEKGLLQASSPWPPHGIVNYTGIYYLNKITLEVEDSLLNNFDTRESTNTIIDCVNDSILVASSASVVIVNLNTKEFLSNHYYEVQGYSPVPPSAGGMISPLTNLSNFSWVNTNSIYTCYYVRHDTLPNFGGYLDILNFSLSSGDTNFVYRMDFEPEKYKEFTGIKATRDGGVLIVASGFYGGSWLIKFMPEGFVNIVPVGNSEPSVITCPNPAAASINISCSELINEIEIFNLLGKRVYSAKVKNKFTTVNTANFEQGNYIARIHTSKGLTTKKFIVAK